MSRFLSFSLLTLLLLATSCGGWSEDQKSQIKNQCLGNGMHDCECYLEKVLEAYPNPDDFNSLSQDDKNALVVDCASEVEDDEEDLESF